MKTASLAIVCGLALASCSPKPSYTYIPNTLNVSPPPTVEVLTPVNLGRKQADAVKAGVREALRDPESARFGKIVAGKDSPEVVTVCGFVNAKNGYGGFTGEQPFLGHLVETPTGPGFSPLSVGGTDREQQSTLIVCRQMGLNPE